MSETLLSDRLPEMWIVPPVENARVTFTHEQIDEILSAIRVLEERVREAEIDLNKAGDVILGLTKEKWRLREQVEHWKEEAIVYSAAISMTYQPLPGGDDD